MSKPPKLKLIPSEPMQDYYCDGIGNRWSVARLIDDAKDLPVFDMPIAGIGLSHQIWAGCNMFQLACHVRKCMDADLSKPILLDWEGDIADGRHRVIAAICAGKTTIKARRFQWRPAPCEAAKP